MIFKRGGTVLTPCSKIQFFSDPDGTNLVKDILAGEEMRADLDPLILNEGKIWVSFEEGTNALLPADMQTEVVAKLECAIFQIPKEWIVVCWLTEVLSSSLISHNVSKSATFSIEVFEKLMKAILVFYDESKAPSVLKSMILKLLSRLVIKLRHVYQQLEGTELFS